MQFLSNITVASTELLCNDLSELLWKMTAISLYFASVTYFLHCKKSDILYVILAGILMGIFLVLSMEAYKF
jgi:hypothetical protein